MHLVFFGLSLSSSWGNGHATTYRGLLQGLHRRGHRLDFWERDTEWYASNRDLPQPTFAQLHIYAGWQEARAAMLRQAAGADAIIVGSYFADAIPLLEELLGHSPVPVVFYDIDTPITLERLRSGTCPYLRAEHIPALELYLSFTGGPVLDELRGLWGARRVETLYCGCDEGALSVPRRGAPRVDLSYLGTFAPDRQGKLERFLLEPARRLPRCRFRVAGPLFPEVESWPANIQYDFHLSPAHHSAFYTDSRATLNLTRQAMVEAGFSPSVRLFEAAAAGTPILSDPWPGLAEFFEPGRDIMVIEDADDVTHALTRTSPAALREMGESGRRRMLAAHTSFHRACQLEASLARAMIL